MTLDYPFTESDAIAAYEEWGANCGPNALAFALQVPLASVRHAIPDFESKRYTSPTMMAAALRNLGREFKPYAFPGFMAAAFIEDMPSLVRVQWTGPWTEPGANPKWAYRATHWIATWKADERLVFDVNGGITTFEVWQKVIVPLLTGAIKRADGGWHPTHVWRVPVQESVTA
jgi:hypothetical protein